MLANFTGHGLRSTVYHSFIRGVKSSARSLPRLTLYTGDDCQLCDVAKVVLEEISRDVPFDLLEYNIRDDNLPDINRWRRAYQYDIPVLHLEGKEIARHRLDKVQVKSLILEVLSQRTDRCNQSVGSA